MITDTEIDSDVRRLLAELADLRQRCPEHASFLAQGLQLAETAIMAGHLCMEMGLACSSTAPAIDFEVETAMTPIRGLV